MRIARLGVLLLTLLLTEYASAQAQVRVRGEVLSAEDQSPLAGVSVQVLGSELVTLTAGDGTFAFEVPEGAVLVFRRIGYRTQEVAVDGRAVVDVALEPMALTLPELVVVGYTTQQRRQVSGAVASVTAEQLETRKVATLEEALRGKVAGVNIVSSGAPGRASQIVVRGQNFLGDPTPLYVVDGLYMGQEPALDPEDIASVEILKDASAAAQYGAQAANGVVVITTKRGRPGATRITAQSYYGFQEVPRRIDLAGTQEWAALTTQAYENAGMPVIPGATNPPGVNTDWQDAVFERGAIASHNLAISGGSETATFRISGGYLNQDGTIIGSGFERYSFRVNSDVRLGRITLGESLALARLERDNMIGFPLVDVVRMPPSIPVLDPSNPGGYGYGDNEIPTFGTNPVGLQETEASRDVSNELFGTVYAEVSLLDNLSYRFNLGVQHTDLNWTHFIEQAQLRQNNPLLPARLTDRRDNTSSLLVENLLSFDDTFGEHAINVVGGYTEQRNQFQRLEAFIRDFPDESLREIDAGTADRDNAGHEVPSALRSFLVRANYVFRDRYLMSASFRRDGSSRFGPDNRWGNFGSGSVGWILSEEPFYQSLPLLGGSVPYLKLRASYGTLGNQDIGDFTYSGSITANESYLFGQDQIATGAIQKSLSNPNIKWQENTMTNVGADLELLDARLALTAEYYRSESDGLLVRAPLPPALGSTVSPFVNAGSVRNTGFELMGTFRQRSGDFWLNTSVNLTTIDNEVTELGNGGQAIFDGPFGVARTAIGGPIGAFYVLQTDGIFQSAAEVAAHGAQPGALPGDVRYVDRNTDGLINDEDRYVAGSAIPDLEGGVFFDGGYRQLDFGVGLRYSAGAEIFNIVKFWTDRGDDPNNFRAGYDPWTPTDPSPTTPRLVFGPAGASNANPVSDRWIESGSYLRIHNIQVGYTLPASLSRTLGLQVRAARVYLNLQNVHTFTGFSNWDVEAAGSGFANPALFRGFDDGAIYPSPRTVTLGLDLHF